MSNFQAIVPKIHKQVANKHREYRWEKKNGMGKSPHTVFFFYLVASNSPLIEQEPKISVIAVLYKQYL